MAPKEFERSSRNFLTVCGVVAAVFVGFLIWAVTPIANEGTSESLHLNLGKRGT